MMLLLVACTAFLSGQSRAGIAQGTEPCSLISAGKSGIVLPLKGTSVNADVSGFGARVTVVQTFTNPTATPLEAVYTFPLPADAAVDRMRMKIGNRIIDGAIKRREEARVIYEAAKNQGQAAALLDQERPNIFTQSVANILPNSNVQIEISYVQLLKYEAGQFEFHFPMVVGPRYLGNAPDPGKIAPPITPKGTRTGADINLTVNLDAGAPITGLDSVLHEIGVDARGPSRAVVTLRKKDEIPNRDFILHYRVATNSVQSALMAKYDPVKGGFFTLVLLPPKAPVQRQIANREVIFVIDQTGSQSGFPIAKSIELTLKLLETMRPGDTFNVIGFTTGVNPLWKASHLNSTQNRAEAASFVKKLVAGGGTDIRHAMEFAYGVPPDPERLRLFIFNSDGYVGDEAEILNTVRLHHGNSRLFTFGIGNSVNRYLIDAMSEEGKGDSEIVTLESNSEEAVSRFMQRTQSPILLNVDAKFTGVDVSDTLPSQIPDVFSDKPIVLYGRYATPGLGKLTLTGNMGGQPWSQTIDITFPSDKPGGESIPTVWARRMVDKLEREYALGTRRAENPMEGQTKVTDLALEFGIMTQYTSFVAVEQRVINIGGKQRTVHVPVEMASGVSYEGAGVDQSLGLNGAQFARRTGMARGGAGTGTGTGTGTGGGGGFGGGGFGGGFGGGAGGAGPPVAAAGKSVNRAGGGFGISSDGRAEGSNYLAFDPTENSFMIKDADLAKLPLADRLKIIGQRRTFLLEQKVNAKLRKAKGGVEVEVWLADLKPETIAKLKKLGLTVDVQDNGTKVVFGRCDAKILVDLAQLKEVRRIEPIS